MGFGETFSAAGGSGSRFYRRVDRTPGPSVDQGVALDPQHTLADAINSPLVITGFGQVKLVNPVSSEFADIVYLRGKAGAGLNPPVPVDAVHNI